MNKKNTKIIRKAVPNDINSIVYLGVEALNKYSYPNLLIDKDKMREIGMECISASCNFSWVSETDNEITGAVCALVHPLMFYERSQASVIQFYCKTPGEGIKLLREFLKWARNRPVIKLICFTLEGRIDPRVGKMLSRLGLSRELPVYLEIK
jgi:hypothetical protein